jgi:hypothetical protein
VARRVPPPTAPAPPPDHREPGTRDDEPASRAPRRIRSAGRPRAVASCRWVLDSSDFARHFLTGSVADPWLRRGAPLSSEDGAVPANDPGPFASRHIAGSHLRCSARGVFRSQRRSGTMPGSTDPRSQTKGRSLFARMPDRQLGVPLIVLVVTIELGWVVWTWPKYQEGGGDALAAFLWPIVFALPVAIGALVGAVAVTGLARGRLWGLAVGLIWAAFEAASGALVALGTLTGLEPSGSEALARRTAPIVFGIATVVSIAVLVLLVRDRRASGRLPPLLEASPEAPIGDDHTRPRQVWPSSRRSSRRRRRPPPTAGMGGPA